MYIPVRYKLLIALACAGLWTGLSFYLALPWLRQLSEILGWPLAWFAVGGVALIPGAANGFLISSLLLDQRPVPVPRRPPPPLTILIAAYNEEDCIRETLQSLARQHYPGPLQIVVIDDGSRDRTREIVRKAIAADPRPPNQHVEVLEMPENGGKARALNAGLAHAAHELIVTLDADTLLYRDALARLVINQLESPPHTAATAGTVLVRNSRKNLITKLQEWDYFLGIAVVKRVQSLLQGTLVAQGAFSIYRREVLREVGGWRETVGEDIVLTWAILSRGYRVGYAENAFVFTNVPETYAAYYRQRKRWSRGLIEAFKLYPSLLLPTRLNAPFVYLNFLFPWLDAAYLFVFVPGVIAALLFQIYWVAGLLTLLVLPLSLTVNVLMFFKQRAVFARHGLRVRRNWLGAVLFTLIYQLVLSPASLAGYLAEITRSRKTW
ncbi:MAG: glycosyltransferase family 2 protein [Nevskia sp.]|nr:glycosyltransferase family 2 protein [Nevskia sp.]